MSHFLDIAIWGVVPIKKYRGCLVEKLGSGYKVLDQVVNTSTEVDQKIDEANNSIKNSLNEKEYRKIK
jgi:hypothetical protein